MEKVTDKIISEVQALSEMSLEDGGFAESLPLKAVYFGDPGLIPQSLYPCATVEPLVTDPEHQTTGADFDELSVVITLHIDARDYFDHNADEAIGDRALVVASGALRRWFRRRSKRTLDGDVTSLEVRGTAYPRPMVRGSVITKSSRTTLVVEKGYARVLD
jgi:hypothetical protein